MAGIRPEPDTTRCEISGLRWRVACSGARGMMETMTSGARKKATREDLRAAYGEDGRAEIIHGVIVEKAAPMVEHSSAQRGLIVALSRRFNRAVGGTWPGGWWLLPEIHTEYEEQEL